ncbi:Protein arginine N-methyltransferase, partial [Lachnellula subtilissima]
MDDPAFTLPTLTPIDENTQIILLHASQHNLAALKPLLRIPGNASVQDPETGFTPLHAAIAACEDEEGDSSEVVVGEKVDIEKAKDVVRELFISGAIWNDLDVRNETPGCLAWRLGTKTRELYELCVEAGVRAEMLLGIMGRYEALDSGEEDDEGEEEADADAMESEMNGHTAEGVEAEEEEKKDVNSADYLASTLKFEDDKLLDADANGVMMSWETNIMRRSVDLLLPNQKQQAGGEGARILNIGFGMGIIDRMFAATKPRSHHIIEAHPAVLEKLAAADSEFSSAWENSAPPGGKYVVHKGRWQDTLPGLLESGEVFDAIYFDTFGEDYSALKEFFSEFVPGLLDENGRFGFFNGLGADRRVCYDVYTRVAELDLSEAGWMW